MNNRDLYKAFTKAKMIYGCTSVHIQLIARQLNVLASEVLDYILAHPDMVTYEIKTQASGYSNPIMGNEYTGLYVKSVVRLPFLTTNSQIMEGSNGATIIVTLENDTFVAGAETEANWTIDVGNTGLTFTTATKNSATQVTLTFTGIVGPGTISIMCEDAGLTGAGYDSDTVQLSVTAKSLDYSTFQDVMPTVGEVIAAVAAGKAFTLTGTPNNDGTVTIDGVVYTWKTALTGTPAAGAVWVLIDGTNNSAANLNAAINGGAGSGTTYKFGAGAAANANVSSANGSAGVVTVTAKIKGISGNLITISEESDNGTWAGGATTLSGGVNGTAAKAGKVLIGALKVAFAKAECFVYNTDGWVFSTYDV